MSSNVSNSVASHKPQPLQSSNSSAQTAAPTQDHRLDSWNASLATVALKDAAAVQTLLEQVAQGIASPKDAPLAQAVFNDLLCHEAFDVFVEVFSAYNAVREAQVREPNDPPFKSSLTLQLPANWTPTGPAAFHAALQKVQVQRLEVVHPEVDESKFQPLTATSELSTLNSLLSFGRVSPIDPQEMALVNSNRALVAEQYDAAVPEVVCDAIVILLQGGTTELSVRGNLAKPTTVGQALSASALQSIELGHENPFWSAISTATLDSYRALMQGLTKCETLQHLILGQSHLLSLHANVENLAPGCPNLKSLHVQSNTISSGEASDLASFMKIAAQCGNLKMVTIKNVSKAAVSKDVFGPLSKLSTLTTLDVELSSSSLLRGAEDWSVMPEVMRFSRSCPSLKHFKLNGPAIPIELSFGFPYLNFPPSDDWATTDFLSDPTINLETVAVSGLPISHLYLSAIFGAIPGNKTLTAFDISGCLVSVNAVLGLPESLIHNETLRIGKLPTDPRLYFMVSNDQRMHRLGMYFQLNIAEDADPIAQEIAKSSYEEIKTKVKSVPTATQALLDNRAAALEALALQVGGVLQIAAPSSSGAFQDVAKLVLPHVVGNAKELRDVVRLAEVSKAADALGLHKGNHSPDSLKAAANAVSNMPAGATTTTTSTVTTTTTGVSSITTSTPGNATATPPDNGTGAPKQG